MLLHWRGNSIHSLSLLIISYAFCRYISFRIPSYPLSRNIVTFSPLLLHWRGNVIHSLSVHILSYAFCPSHPLTTHSHSHNFDPSSPSHPHRLSSSLPSSFLSLIYDLLHTEVMPIPIEIITTSSTINNHTDNPHHPHTPYRIHEVVVMMIIHHHHMIIHHMTNNDSVSWRQDWNKQ